MGTVYSDVRLFFVMLSIQQVDTYLMIRVRTRSRLVLAFSLVLVLLIVLNIRSGLWPYLSYYYIS